MTLTGNLVLTVQQTDARRPPGPSGRHGETELSPYPDKTTVPTGQGSEFEGTAFAQVMTTGHHMVLDTPASYLEDPHNSRGIFSWEGTEEEFWGGGNRLAAHDGSQDRGWMRTWFTPAPLFGEVQERAQDDVDGFSNWFAPGTEPDLRKYTAGINSRQENNPPITGYVNGYRPGRFQIRHWDNHMFHSTTMEHGIQLIQAPDYTPPLNHVKVHWSPTLPQLPGTVVNPDDSVQAAQSYASSDASTFGGF